MSRALIPRTGDLRRVRSLLREFPVVVLLGAHRVGKSTLARRVAGKGRCRVLDPEDPADRALLREPGLALKPLRGVVVLDGVRRRPDLLPILRVLADRPRRPARFLVLGSASPELLCPSPESPAGRIAFHELGGLSLADVGAAEAERLWVRGGFPDSFRAATDDASFRWRERFLRDFVERDLPGLGIRVATEAMGRFLVLLAHDHGRFWNAAGHARALGVAESTVKRWLDLLASTFAVRLLAPWHENLSKRQVRSPRVFLSDSGLLHALLGLPSMEDLLRHPKVGASWEGFVVEAVIRRLGVPRDRCFCWATHAGAELDLLVVRGNRRLGFECKRTDAPRVTKSMRIAREDLRLDSLAVIHAGAASFPMGEGIRAVALRDLEREVRPN